MPELVPEETETCDRCGSEESEGSLALVIGASELQWCADCVSAMTVCQGCDTYVRRPYVMRLSCCGTRWCEGCYDSIDRGYCDDCDRSYCYDCGHECPYDDDRSGSGMDLRSYTYKPAPLFKGSGPRFLGMELEVNVQDCDLVDSIHSNHGDLLYCKADSSVDDGFELVTHPMTYDWAVTNFPWHLLDAMKDLGDAGRNGLHVHVSRDAFADTDHALAWLHLWYCNPAQVEAMARRDPEQWARLEVGPENPTPELLSKVQRSSNRYTAVNCCNAETFEVRVFASTLEKCEVIASLALVDASVEYTRDAGIEHLEWDQFASWVFNQGDRYPELAEEIVRRVVPLQLADPAVTSPRRARDVWAEATPTLTTYTPRWDVWEQEPTSWNIRLRQPVSRDDNGRWRDRMGRFTYAARYAHDTVSPTSAQRDGNGRIRTVDINGVRRPQRVDQTVDGCECGPCMATWERYDRIGPGERLWFTVNGEVRQVY